MERVFSHIFEIDKTDIYTIDKQSSGGVLRKRCFAKKVFLRISQNSLEKICAGV